jgi:glutamine synthetase adenylyltransferase
MAGSETVLESAALVAAIDRSADAPTARTVVARVIEACPAVAEELTSNALLRDGLIVLACASRSLSSALIADATLLDPLRDPEGFPGEGVSTTTALVAPGRPQTTGASPVEAAGVAPHRRARSARCRPPCRRAELAARPGVLGGGARGRCRNGEIPFSVIGMGKLAGVSSTTGDVDVLFVHDGDNRAERGAMLTS